MRLKLLKGKGKQILLVSHGTTVQSEDTIRKTSDADMVDLFTFLIFVFA